MTLARISTAVMACSIAVIGLIGAVSATPQDYCVAYAGQLAHKKMGTASDPSVETGEKWQGAYNQAFVRCMENYEPQPPTASTVRTPSPSKSKLSSKPQRAKASIPSSKSTKSKAKKASKAKKPSEGKQAAKSRKARTMNRPTALTLEKPKSASKAIGPCTAQRRSVARCKTQGPIPTTIKIVTEPAGP